MHRHEYAGKFFEDLPYLLKQAFITLSAENLYRKTFPRPVNFLGMLKTVHHWNLLTQRLSRSECTTEMCRVRMALWPRIAKATGRTVE